MLIALTPFRYGKGSEHWNFAPNDPIKDGIIADGDISGLIAKKLIMNDATEMAAEGLNTSEIDNNKVSNSGYDHYLQSSIGEWAGRGSFPFLFVLQRRYFWALQN